MLGTSPVVDMLIRVLNLKEEQSAHCRFGLFACKLAVVLWIADKSFGWVLIHANADCFE